MSKQKMSYLVENLDPTILNGNVRVQYYIELMKHSETSNMYCCITYEN